ncbi:MAG: amino acid ABC transporter substrate-binding protein [Cyclobacteriaceae bacterium]|nr:amino acid ABC transporter substrate-binding protein [Cyclobacteriaceae bacterium]
MRSIILVITLVVCAFQNLNAQDYKRMYKNAKEFYTEGRYNLAMEAFKPLMIYDKNNPYPEYASFYFAQSALKQNYTAVAKDMLLSIRKLYPNWDQMNEVNYWLAKIYFDQHEYFQGMLVLKSVRQEDYIETQAISSFRRFYLSQITDPEVLRMMWEEYPEDIEVGKSLARAISRQQVLLQDRVLMDSVIAKFNLPRENYISAGAPPAVFKDHYNVSVLFPFLTSTLDPSPGKKQNQVMLDLYEGMRMANDTLYKQGVNIKLLAYDTDRNPAVIAKLLETPELKNTDLIVGPLFRETAPAVLEFSQKNQISMINPAQSYSDFIGQNPFALLYLPSLETIGAKSAELLAAKVKNKKCMIFYGDKPKDSVMAISFSKRAKELGMKITLEEEFKKETALKIINILATPTEFDEFHNPKQFKLNRDSLGSIFVASDDPLIYTKVISSVETRGDSVVIIGSENWLDNNSVDLTKYERLHVLFAAPTFTSLTQPSFINFRKKYVKTHGAFSQEYINYTKLGYDFMIFAGQALKKYGSYFQDGLTKDGLFPGYLSKGYLLSPNRDNQTFPFIYFRQGELTALE